MLQELKRGDIVTYQSPAYGMPLRVRLTVQFVTPQGEDAWDAVIINEQGEEDIAGFFFTSVWLKPHQIIPEES